VNLSQLLDQHRLVVCVGTGGVGKTTIAAALAINAAQRGRRVLVLTIDPARALARAFGFERLSSSGQISSVLLSEAQAQVTGTLDAAMLDQQKAWDALVRRYSPTLAIRDAILRNRFYRELSSRFPGSTEYIAMEEVARLRASDRYDLIVLDTPPAEHALDFVRAPARLGHLLTRDLDAWTRHPVSSTGMRSLVTRLIKAVGSRTFREVIDLFSDARNLIGAVRERSEAAAELLHDASTAFVLITSVSENPSAAAGELAATLRTEGIRLKGAIGNRGHPLPGSERPDLTDRVDEVVTRLGASAQVSEWLRAAHRNELAMAIGEHRYWSELRSTLGDVSTWVIVPEMAHDVCSLRDLVGLAEELNAGVEPLPPNPLRTSADSAECQAHPARESPSELAWQAQKAS
jgi:anion-transporting  ArsA/GET3 family ATPase